MKIKLNADFGSMGLKGTVIVLDGNDGVPTSKYWRRRLADSKIDNCCEVVQPKESKPEKVSGKSKKLKGDNK